MTENFKEKIVIAKALKVRLFAQYWGVKCLRNTLLNDKIPPHKIYANNCKGDSFQYLELKDALEVSEEDALEVARLFLSATGNEVDLESFDIFEVKTLIKECNFLPYQCVDYLRSKGYALPFMEYSVDQLIEFGWVKII